ncbi:MAG: hypothetical protein ABL994_08475, partial [Verrucomicrobiales bacterium]
PRPESAREWLAGWQRALDAAGISANTAEATMRTANPVFIPRNPRIEAVIVAARDKNFAPFHQLHSVLQRPFEEQEENSAFESPPLAHEVVQATFCGT